MDEKIQNLIDLQRIELALRAIEQERQQGPIRLAELAATFEETSQTVGAVKHRYEALRDETASLETELKDFQAKLAKFQVQLMAVKNNKEYSAVLKEIDQAKIEIAKRDEGILARMQEMETLQSDLPAVEARLAAETGAYDRERAEIESAMRTLDRRRDELIAERRRTETFLPKDVVATFYRVAEVRRGLAVTRITEAMCGACNVRLRPQVFQEVKRGDTLLTCDSCRRYLYYEPASDAGGASGPGTPGRPGPDDGAATAAGPGTENPTPTG